MSEINGCIYTAVEYKGDIYYIESIVNSLMKFCHETNVIEPVCVIDTEPKDILYRNAFRYNNIAWFIPWSADEILRVNLDTFEAKFYPIPCNIRGKKYLECYPYAKFHVSVRVNDEEIFLMPSETDAGILLNLKSSEMHLFSNIIDPEKELIWCGDIVEDEIWMKTYDTNRLIVLNLNTKKIREIKFDIDLDMYEDCVFWENNLWFSPNKTNSLLKVNVKTNQVSHISIPSNYDLKVKYGEINVFDNRLWMFSESSDAVLVYEPVNEKWCLIKIPVDLKNSLWAELKRVEYPNRLVAVSGSQSGLLFFCKDNDYEIKKIIFNREKMYQILFDTYDGNFKKMVKHCRYSNGTYAERYMGLNNFINNIVGEI